MNEESRAPTVTPRVVEGVVERAPIIVGPKIGPQSPEVTVKIRRALAHLPGVTVYPAAYVIDGDSNATAEEDGGRAMTREDERQERR